MYVEFIRAIEEGFRAKADLCNRNPAVAATLDLGNIRAAAGHRGSPRSTLKRQRHGSSSNLILAIDAPTGRELASVGVGFYCKAILWRAS
jgi:hypothetical protein